MKNLFPLFGFVFFLGLSLGCKKDQAASNAEMAAPTGGALSNQELLALAESVPSEGPREGNNYKVFFLVVHQNQQPAKNFKVDMQIKGGDGPITVRTNERGLATFENLPFPSPQNPLIGTLHYYEKGQDYPRTITYPFLPSDEYRLKDRQEIPNSATPDPVTEN